MIADGTTVLNLVGSTTGTGGVVTTGNQTYLDNVLIGDPDGVVGDDTVSAANLLSETLADTDAGFVNSIAVLRSTGSGTIRVKKTIAKIIPRASGIRNSRSFLPRASDTRKLKTFFSQDLSNERMALSNLS